MRIVIDTKERAPIDGDDRLLEEAFELISDLWLKTSGFGGPGHEGR
jgi:hypothetical protein